LNQFAVGMGFLARIAMQISRFWREVNGFLGDVL
jgi:hypothetical protein